MRKYFWVVFTLLLLLAHNGCGNNSMLSNAPYYGALEGYVYTAAYNTTLARPVDAAARAAAQTTPTGYIPVQNAIVVIAGQDISTTTNASGYFTLADVPTGAQTVRVSKTGMQTLDLSVTIAQNVTANLNDQNTGAPVALTPATSGTLVVTAVTDESVPRTVNNATVYFGNTPTSKTTNPAATIDDIAAGTYSDVNVRAPGYNDSDWKSATITDGQTTTLSFTLSPTDGNYPPRVTITSPNNGQSFSTGSAINFAATATDNEEGALSGASVVWTSSVNGQIGTGTSISISTLSAGEHTITCTATDSTSKSGSDSVTINVINSSSPNTGPTAVIVTPTTNSSYASSQNITFTGTGTDPEDGALTGSSLVWTSSLDGQIGTGNAFQKSGLSVGAHTITLTATDTGSFTGTDSISLTITQGSTGNQSPTATIITPTNGSSSVQNSNVVFSGAGTDTEDGAITGARLVWTSSRDGQIGTGNFFQLSTLSAGTHTITLTVYDSAGATGTTTVVITITAASGNQPPTAIITTPVSGTTGTTTVPVLFSGTATDPEDGVLSGTSLVWSSSLDGALGTGTAFTKSMSAGNHIVTLTATDSGGSPNATTTTLIVN